MAIFREDGDWRRFLELLMEAKQRSGLRIHAYCLMPNHFHFIVRVGIVPLSQVMQTLLTSYANYFNWRHNRIGHLFQSRFKAIHCPDDRYLLTLLRYIHRNPVRAGLARCVGDWPWSSHSAYVAGEDDLTDVMPLLGMLQGGNGYLDLLDDPEGDVSPEPLLAAPSAEAPPTIHAGPVQIPPALDQLAKVVATEARVQLGAILSDSRLKIVAAARRTLIQRALSNGIRPSAIARFLNRSPALVTKYGQTITK